MPLNKNLLEKKHEQFILKNGYGLDPTHVQQLIWTLINLRMLRLIAAE